MRVCGWHLGFSHALASVSILIWLIILFEYDARNQDHLDEYQEVEALLISGEIFQYPCHTQTCYLPIYYLMYEVNQESIEGRWSQDCGSDLECARRFLKQYSEGDEVGGYYWRVQPDVFVPSISSLSMTPVEWCFSVLGVVGLLAALVCCLKKPDVVYRAEHPYPPGYLSGIRPRTRSSSSQTTATPERVPLLSSPRRIPVISPTTSARAPFMITSASYQPPTPRGSVNAHSF